MSKELDAVNQEINSLTERLKVLYRMKLALIPDTQRVSGHSSLSEQELCTLALKIIDQNVSNLGFNLEALALAIGISPTVVSAVLNQTFKQPFRRLLNEARIKEAKRLIASSGLSMKQIALETGFSDSHYFSRTFKRFAGISPTDFLETSRRTDVPSSTVPVDSNGDA